MIIGGGSRPDHLIQRMIDETTISDHGHAIVLTMSGFDPDTSGFYGERSFRNLGISNIHSFDLGRRDDPTPEKLDSLRTASLVYITGGVQSRFMERVAEFPEIADALEDAYQNGALISGSSAGAAVMSKIMITGDQKNYLEYTSTFYNLEPDNMVTDEGLGLIEGIIVDQHFVKRARNNRLLSAIMDYPDHIGIGIDESTGILVQGNTAEVVGNSQVFVYRNLSGASKSEDNKLGAENIRLDIYLPGDVFELEPYETYKY